jgi:lipoprotein Spr/probable lipoprotein NlpC
MIKLSLLSLFISISACSSLETSRESYIYSILEQEPELKEIVLKKSKNKLSDRELPLWRAIGYLGTPYRFGSDTYSELDCSAFMRKIFHPEKSLQRTAYGQFKQFKKFAKWKPAKGDLVFFRTAKYNPATHVGIMYNDRKFIHASTSHGIVTVGDLKDSYWKKRVYAYVDPSRQQYTLSSNDN